MLPQVRFVVMNNIFHAASTGLPIHRRYDLKGSTQGRGAGIEAPPAGAGVILKDLDLDLSLRLEEGWHDRQAPAHLWHALAQLLHRHAHPCASVCIAPVPAWSCVAYIETQLHDGVSPAPHLWHPMADA